MTFLDQDQRIECCCSEFEFFIDDYLEDTLDPVSKQQFEAHHASCSCCQQSLQETKELIALARSLARAPIPVEVSARLRERLRELFVQQEQ